MKNITVLLTLLILQVVSVYLCYYNGKTFFTDREQQGKTSPKIFDLLHKYLPDYSEKDHLGYLMNIAIFFPLIMYPQIISQFISFMIPIMMFRYVTTNVTILPKSKNCKDENFGIFNLINGHCYDKIFSGHFACSIIISLLLYNNNLIDNVGVLALYNVISAYLILVSRSHYTVDILLGGYVAATSFALGININCLV